MLDDGKVSDILVLRYDQYLFSYLFKNIGFKQKPFLNYI